MFKIIDAKTEAVTSTSAYEFQNAPQVALIQQGLSGSEEIVIQYSIDGSVWTDLYQYGRKITLSATNNVLGIYAACLIRAVKPVTVAIQARDR